MDQIQREKVLEKLGKIKELADMRQFMDRNTPPKAAIDTREE